MPVPDGVRHRHGPVAAPGSPSSPRSPGWNEPTALAALAAGLVEPDVAAERCQFQHALIRHAVYLDLNPSRRVRLHRRLAEVLAAVRKALDVGFRFPMMDARLAQARLCGLDGRFDEATQWFDAARVVLDAERARPLRAIVDHDEALVRLRAGAPDEAAGLLAAALRQFEDLGMVGWVTRAGQLRVRAQDGVHRR
jgi:tetratricopeptide (TPR) repeat protein